MQKKSQVISMDFIMTFVMYLFAISIFFFALKDALAGEPKLSVKPETVFSKFTGSELLFNKLSNVYDEDYGFLESSTISSNFNTLMTKYEPMVGYELYFKDFDNPAFLKIDYCIFLEEISGQNKKVLRNFAAWEDTSHEYSAQIMQGVECGTDYDMQYTNAKPSCSSRDTDSLLLAKPVLYSGKIVHLKVLMCAEKRG